MLPIIKELFVLIFFPCLIFSCSFAQEKKKKNQNFTYPTSLSIPASELTPEQESAFDALNTIQVSTDKKNRLYSTFADVTQHCYPPDTNVVITQAEFLSAMIHFGKENCKNLNIEERDKLIKSSVLAKEEYIVLHCTGNSSNLNYKEGLPMIGTWVIPSVLGRRDIVIVW